jgi:DNA-binding transcriptional LysR family regulator
MQLRSLGYLVTLSRERHFGRAAKACNVSQPALSQALRQLEASFGVPIVLRRNQGFHEFTPEGKRILDWARRVLADHDQLAQEISHTRSDGLAGHLRLGVIPVATPTIALLTSAFHACHPAVTMSVQSQPMTDIYRGLDRFDIDAGISYLDGVPPLLARCHALYQERYYLLVPASHPLAREAALPWREVAGLPLCLLAPDMQYRVILNRIFSDVSIVPRTVIDTNCAVSLCSHVRSGQWFTIVPQSFFYLINDWTSTRAIDLIDPVVKNDIGLLVPDRDPLPPLTLAFIEAIQSVDLSAAIPAMSPPAALPVL